MIFMESQDKKTKSNATAPGSITSIVLLSGGDKDIIAAELLSKKFDVGITHEMPEQSFTGLALRIDGGGLSLIGGGQALYGDFSHLLPRAKQNNLGGELLVKAAKIKGAADGLTAIDATAGLGEDSFLLAAAGFKVSLYERDPVIAELLQDAMQRASDVPELKDIIGRMKLFMDDSLNALPKLTDSPDIVLLDPMFPARQKSGLIKKKFQLLQQLEQPCTDEEELMNAALSCRPKKVIVKRPANGAYLGSKKPNYAIKGKTIRYDCIVVPQE